MASELEPLSPDGLGNEYFEELLARIRDIRSSERIFWQTEEESVRVGGEQGRVSAPRIFSGR